MGILGSRFLPWSMDENIPRLWDLDQEKGLGPGESFSLGSAWTCGMGIPKGCAGIIWEDPGGKETENTGLESSRMVLEDGMAGGRQGRVPKAGFGHHGSIPGHSRGMSCAIRTEIQPGNFVGIRPHFHCWKFLVGAKVGEESSSPTSTMCSLLPKAGNTGSRSRRSASPRPGCRRRRCSTPTGAGAGCGSAGATWSTWKP